MRKTKAWRKAVALVVLSGLMALVTGGGSASAAHFFETAAINDDKFEVRDPEGHTQSLTYSTSSGLGIYVDVMQGVEYRVKVSGTFAYTPETMASGQPGRVADAECSIDVIGDLDTGSQWQSERWTTNGSDRLDLVVTDGSTLVPFRWTPSVPYELLSVEGENECSRNNTYYFDVKPQKTFLKVILNDSGWRDNAGQFTVTVSRAAFHSPRIWMGTAYQCPKWPNEEFEPRPGFVGSIAHADMMIDSRRNGREISDPAKKDLLGNHIYPFNNETGHWGMYTCNYGLSDTTYKITVDGVWLYDEAGGHIGLADAECSTGSPTYEDGWKEPRESDPGLGAFIHDRYTERMGDTNPANDVDRFDMWVNSVKNIDWIPVYPDPDNPKCAGDEAHSYYTLYRPTEPGPIRIEVGDYDYHELNNRGMICIHIEKLGLEGGHEAPQAQQDHSGVLKVADFTLG